VAEGVREGLPLRTADGVIVLMTTLGAAYAFLEARWAPGAVQSGLVFASLGGALVGLRALARRTESGLLDGVASHWLLPTAVLVHCNLGPLVDAIHPRLFDATLARIDLSLFGVHPGVFLEQVVPPWGMDVLLVCYYSYFLWPTALAVLLFKTRARGAFEEYALCLTLYFFANFLLYIAVPALGPRFFLASEFSGPLRGLWLTPYLDSLLRTPPFMRDCFPSGHTGVMLLVLLFAHRHHRKFFWVALPFALGLFMGTVAGRFHYVIDLFCAVPLVLATSSVAAAVARAPLARLARPGPLEVRSPLEI
jgi:hypothetical protein